MYIYMAVSRLVRFPDWYPKIESVHLVFTHAYAYAYAYASASACDTSYASAST